MNKEMAILFMLMITLFLTACASIAVLPERFVYDKMYKKYVQEFSTITGIPEEELKKIKYKIAPTLPNNAVAICSFDVRTKDNRQITISFEDTIWQSDIERKATIFHELAHCYCGRPHIKLKGSYWKMIGLDGSKNDGNCPISLMYPSTIDKGCLEENWEEYVSELISFCPADLSYLNR